MHDGTLRCTRNNSSRVLLGGGFEASAVVWLIPPDPANSPVFLAPSSVFGQSPCHPATRRRAAPAASCLASPIAVSCLALTVSVRAVAAKRSCNRDSFAARGFRQQSAGAAYQARLLAARILCLDLGSSVWPSLGAAKQRQAETNCSSSCMVQGAVHGAPSVPCWPAPR